jgi:hypothetical protein
LVEIGWKFAPYSARANGLNEAGENTFSGELITGFVREVIQNSVDAANEGSTVRVLFTLDKLQGSALLPLQEAGEYIEAGLRFSDHISSDRRSRNQEPSYLERAEQSFFKLARETISQPEVTVLGIHDYGTTGLTGAISHASDLAQNSSWLALTRGSGVSVNKHGGAGGSHGIGHNAPFAISNINTVFYVSTREKEPGLPETLFQAAMRLRTIQKDFFEDGHTSIDQYGYFGQRDSDEPLPLVGDDIPEWAKALRPKSSEIGTSVVVANPIDIPQEKLWLLIAGAAITNFYVAFENGHLSVQVGERHLINKDTVRDQWRELIESGSYQELLGSSRTSEKDTARIEFVTTRHRPEEKGTLDLDGLGHADWSLRKGDDVTQKGVAFARGRGMYISHFLPSLRLGSIRRFPTFSLFVSLGESPASQVIRAMENPSHTEVSIDEVKNLSEKAEIDEKYNRIKTAVIGLLDELFPKADDEEFALSSFSKFFQLPFGSGDDEKEPVSARVTVGKLSRIKRREGTPTEILDGSDSGFTPREGEAERNYRPTGGEGFETPEGEGGNRGRKNYGVEVKDLRLVPVSGEPNVRTVHFTPLDSERKNLVLYRSGQNELQRLQFRPPRGSDWSTQLLIPNIKKTRRVSLRLEFKDEDLRYPIEGRLEP